MKGLHKQDWNEDKKKLRAEDGALLNKDAFKKSDAFWVRHPFINRLRAKMATKNALLWIDLTKK